MKSGKKQSSLSSEEISQTRQTLLQLSQRLRMQIPSELIEISPVKSAQAGEASDRLNPLTSLRLENSERIITLLKRVEETIKRISDNCYGLCVECGREIDKKMLVDNITESRCRDCKGKNPDQGPG